MFVTPKPIVVVGSINIDLVASTERIPLAGETIIGHDFQVHPGGKGANQAVAVARLGYPVKFIGRLGRDGFAVQLREHLEAVGVDLTGVMATEGPSGVAVIVVSSTGENCIVVTPGANAQLTPQDLDDNIDTIRSAAMVLTQLEIPLETVQHLAALCLREQIPLLLDPAPARSLPKEILEACTWFTPNESEAAFFLPRAESQSGEAAPSQVAQELMKQGVRGVVLKLGARGAFLADGNAQRLIHPFAVKPVDTTAAGDAFNGAFATALCSGQDPLAGARFAAAAAAISVTRAGAQTSMPTRPEVEQMLLTVDATRRS